MADPQTPPPSGSVDPITGFWRDVWARSAAAGGGMPGMAGMPGMPGMPGMSDPNAVMGGFMSPEAMRRMQGAFYEAMAQYAEQYMRTPQFLQSMKRSMDQAMQFRQQMDDFLKTNMSTAFESATGGANSEILGAIRHSTAQLQAQIAKLESRLAEVEASSGVKPKSAPTPQHAEPKPAKQPEKKSAKR